MGVVDELVGKALAGLKSLQVSGQARLDGGVDIQGVGKLNGRNLATTPNPYQTAAYRAVNQVAVAGAFQVAQMDTKRWDPNNNMDVTVNLGRYTCSQEGVYLVCGAFRSGTGRNICSIAVNGGEVRRGNDSGVTGTGLACSVAARIYCFVGDYIELWVLPATATITGDTVSTYIDIAYEGPLP